MQASRMIWIDETRLELEQRGDSAYLVKTVKPPAVPRWVRIVAALALSAIVEGLRRAGFGAIAAACFCTAACTQAQWNMRKLSYSTGTNLLGLNGAIVSRYGLEV